MSREVTQEWADRSIRARFLGQCLHYAPHVDEAADQAQRLIDKFTSVIGNPGEADKDIRNALTDETGEWSLAAAAVWLAADQATSKDEFERLLGLYSHGYKSPLRDAVYANYSAISDKRDCTLTDLRRGCRRAFWKLNGGE